MSKRVLALSFMAVLAASMLTVLGSSMPALAAAMSVTVSPSNANTGVESTYTITFTTETRAFVKRVIIDFPHTPASNKFDVSGAVLGHAEGIREDGTISVNTANSVITYETPRKQRINADRTVSLTITGIENPSAAGTYTVSVATEAESSGSTVDSGSDTSVAISSSASSEGSGALDFTNTDGSITISASDSAGTPAADVSITAEDDIIMNADDIELDAAGELDLNADGDSITLDAADDGTNEIVITDTTAGATGGLVTVNAALTTESLQISGINPTLTLTETDGSLAPTEAALTVNSDNLGIQTDNAAGLLTTRLEIKGGINAGMFTFGDANPDTLNMGNDAFAAIDTINLLTGADGTADVFNLGGTGADDINLGSATSVLSITSTGLNVVDAGTISDGNSELVIDDALVLSGATTIASVAGETTLTDTTTNVFVISGTNTITKISWGAANTAAPIGTIVYLIINEGADFTADTAFDNTQFGEIFLTADFTTAGNSADPDDDDTLVLISNGNDWLELTRSDNP